MDFCSPCKETGFSEIVLPCHSSKHLPLRGEISLKMSSQQKILASKSMVHCNYFADLAKRHSPSTTRIQFDRFQLQDRLLIRPYINHNY